MWLVELDAHGIIVDLGRLRRIPRRGKPFRNCRRQVLVTNNVVEIENDVVSGKRALRPDQRAPLIR